LTTYTLFQPTITQAFQFQPTIGGTVYTVNVPWNIFGQRYFVEVYSLSGTRLLTVPLVGSPNTYSINLTAGVIASGSLVFREQSQQFEAT